MQPHPLYPISPKTYRKRSFNKFFFTQVRGLHSQGPDSFTGLLIQKCVTKSFFWKLKEVYTQSAGAEMANSYLFYSQLTLHCLRAILMQSSLPNSAIYQTLDTYNTQYFPPHKAHTEVPSLFFQLTRWHFGSPDESRSMEYSKSKYSSLRKTSNS